MGNHLGPFLEAWDGPEGQEQPVQAVGGQGELRGVTQFPSKLETWFFLKTQVFGYGESFGTILRGPRWAWRARTACTGCRRSRRTSWSNSASKQARDLIFFKPRFLRMGNHLGPLHLQNNLLTELCYLWTVDYFKYQKNKVIFLCLQNFQREKNRLNLIYELAIHFTLFSGNCSIVIHLLEEYAYMWVWWDGMQRGKISKTKM